MMIDGAADRKYREERGDYFNCDECSGTIL
jgi:hypothetical protein